MTRNLDLFALPLGATPGPTCDACGGVIDGDERKVIKACTCSPKLRDLQAVAHDLIAAESAGSVAILLEPFVSAGGRQALERIRVYLELAGADDKLLFLVEVAADVGAIGTKGEPS